MLPEAVIFDVDGLLVDTETCDYQAWRELYAAHGRELTLEAYCYNAGLYGCWDALYAELAAGCGLSPDALHARREPVYRRLVEACLRPTPELTSLLRRLREHGVKRGVASSSDADWVAYLLEGLGLEGEFQAVAHGQDVRRRKPAPDVYLLAAERLGAAPERCVALEDSAHGIQAAREAGLRVIVVPNLVSAYQDLAAADARVGNLGEVTMELLHELVRGSVRRRE